jgi:tellurite resistance protein TehA-like permease
MTESEIITITVGVPLVALFYFKLVFYNSIKEIQKIDRSSYILKYWLPQIIINIMCAMSNMYNHRLILMIMAVVHSIRVIYGALGRCKDIGINTWYAVLLPTPLVGFIANLYLICKRSSNR